MSRSCGESAITEVPTVMLWNLKVSPFNAPKAHAAAIALRGFHEQNITSAIEIHPAPAVIFSCQRGTKKRERYAPASPQTKPPART